MALDIREGDIYVVNNIEYPIRSCAAWSWSYGAGIKRLLRLTASTKRSPGIVDGKRSGPVTFLTGVKSTPLDPVSPDIAQRLGLNTPHELLETFVDGGNTFYHLILEELKRS